MSDGKSMTLLISIPSFVFQWIDLLLMFGYHDNNDMCAVFDWSMVYPNDSHTGCAFAVKNCYENAVTEIDSKDSTWHNADHCLLMTTSSTWLAR